MQYPSKNRQPHIKGKQPVKRHAIPIAKIAHVLCIATSLTALCLAIPSTVKAQLWYQGYNKYNWQVVSPNNDRGKWYNTTGDLFTNPSVGTHGLHGWMIVDTPKEVGQDFRLEGQTTQYPAWQGNTAIFGFPAAGGDEVAKISIQFFNQPAASYKVVSGADTQYTKPRDINTVKDDTANCFIESSTVLGDSKWLGAVQRRPFGVPVGLPAIPQNYVTPVSKNGRIPSMFFADTAIVVKINNTAGPTRFVSLYIADPTIAGTNNRKLQVKFLGVTGLGHNAFPYNATTNPNGRQSSDYIDALSSSIVSVTDLFTPNTYTLGNITYASSMYFYRPSGDSLLSGIRLVGNDDPTNPATKQLALGYGTTYSRYGGVWLEFAIGVGGTYGFEIKANEISSPNIGRQEQQATIPDQAPILTGVFIQ
jgi:hypothetical protein